MSQVQKFKSLFNKEFDDGVIIPDTVKKNYKNGVSDWIGRRLVDTSPILYISSISGADKKNEKLMEKLSGVDHRCFSYAYCGQTSPMVHNRHVDYLDKLLKKGTNIFMDSGAHSLHRMLRSGKTLAKDIPKDLRMQFVEKLTEEYIEKYAEYIRWCYATGKVFDFHVTLDAQRNCALIYKITKQLFKLGIKPIPVYHGDASLDWVRRYIDDGHKLLGVGISRKGIKGKEAEHRYYSSIFELTEKYGMAVHGFAITGAKMFNFPFWSVDSATHIKAAGFGKILVVVPEKKRLAQVHISKEYSAMTSYGNVSSLYKSVKKHLRDLVEANGFDYDKLQKSVILRTIYNARILQEAVKLNTKQKIKWETWGALV